MPNKHLLKEWMIIFGHVLLFDAILEGSFQLKSFFWDTENNRVLKPFVPRHLVLSLSSVTCLAALLCEVLWLLCLIMAQVSANHHGGYNVSSL